MLDVLSCTAKPCGACCLDMGPYPVLAFLRKGEPLPESLRGELEARERAGDLPWLGEPCIWLDLPTRQCRHYEHRPQICREAVQVGDSQCARARAKYAIPAG